MEELKQGYYRHFKGHYYYLVEVAYHSETLEPMVVYRALYGERKLWVRPASMWNEIVDKPEYHGPRFIPVDMEEVPVEFLCSTDSGMDECFWNEEEETCEPPTVWDIDPVFVQTPPETLGKEQMDFLQEYLFKGDMSVALGYHLLQCAMSEGKAKNANQVNVKPNGRCVSIMLLAMDELGLLVFQPRKDMTQILSLIFGTWIEDDKHFLDYFYTPQNTRRVLTKLEEYKQAIRLWLSNV